MDSVNIQLYTGLTGDTPLLVGENLKDIRSIFLSCKSHPTFGLDKQYKPTECEVSNIPKEMYTFYIHEMHLSNGYTLKCTPLTKVLVKGGWKAVRDIKENDIIKGMSYTSSAGIMPKELTVDRVQEVKKVLQEPVYFFMSTTGNILLPHYEPTVGIDFIAVKM